MKARVSKTDLYQPREVYQQHRRNLIVMQSLQKSDHKSHKQTQKQNKAKPAEELQETQRSLEIAALNET